MDIVRIEAVSQRSKVMMALMLAALSQKYMHETLIDVTINLLGFLMRGCSHVHSYV